MDEDQEAIRVLFGQRLDHFYYSSGITVETSYTLANAIALMDDFPIDVLDHEYSSFLHKMGGINNGDLIETTFQIVRTLVERGNNINLDVPDHRLDWTPICCAAATAGDADVVRLFIELGADVRENYALSASIRFGHFHLMPILLEAGALAEGFASFCVPIDHAPIHKNVDIFKTLNEAGNPHFPYAYELLFAKEPFCKPGTDQIIDGGVECLSYLINWNWRGLEEAKEDVEVLAERKEKYQDVIDSDGEKVTMTGFDLGTAPDELLDPDPRLRWLRRAILKQHIPAILEEEKEQQQQQKDAFFFLSNTRPLLSTLKEMLSRKKHQQYPTPSRPHAIPLHRALSCDVTFCSWMGQEGYIRALVTVDPTAVEDADEITGLYAFQLAALRRGDLDSSYQLLRMCPCLLDMTHQIPNHQ